MLRPIQVAPLSQQRLISQNPLVPNNMTQEDVLRNAMATPGSAPLTPNMAARPLLGPAQTPAPTAADLGAVGQAGLQSAERISKSVTRSPGVQGLLGGGQSAAGLLGDISGQADLQGLFATLSAMGRPVARGESRLLGAVEYGQQARQQAREQGLQDMSTQMKLEEMARQRQRDELRREALEGIAQRTQGQPAGELNTFSTYAISQMDPNQRAVAQRAETLSAEADRLALVDPELSKQFRDNAKDFRDQALRGIRTQEEANKIELSESEKFSKRYSDPANEVMRRRNSLVSLLEGGGAVGNYVSFVNALKSVEPDSAVLSSEFDSATSLGALTTRIQSALAQLDKNERLPLRIREDLERVADLMAQASVDYYNMGVQDIKQRAGRLALNADNIITPIMPMRGAKPDVPITEDDESAVDAIMGGSST
jgi:hypothetical protein